MAHQRHLTCDSQTSDKKSGGLLPNLALQITTNPGWSRRDDPPAGAVQQCQPTPQPPFSSHAVSHGTASAVGGRCPAAPELPQPATPQVFVCVRFQERIQPAARAARVTVSVLDSFITLNLHLMENRDS